MFARADVSARKHARYRSIRLAIHCIGPRDRRGLEAKRLLGGLRVRTAARDAVDVSDDDAEHDKRDDDAGQDKRMIDHGCAPSFTAVMVVSRRSPALT